ncbi:MAG: hypothetical protein V1754_10535 [Pseudomonadota bacterium]
MFMKIYLMFVVLLVVNSCSDETLLPDAGIDQGIKAETGVDQKAVVDTDVSDVGLSEGGGMDGLQSDHQSGDMAESTCEQIEVAYLKELPLAKKCTPGAGIPQCSDKVENELSCPCPTFVNNATVLNQLKAQWDGKGCISDKACPPIPCPDPTSAGCDTITLSCTDIF